MKSLTSKRLADFLDDSVRASLSNNEPATSEAGSKTIKLEKYSIINLEPALFGTDESVDEAPLLFVGKTLENVDPTQNLLDIIESFKVFKEISLIEDAEEHLR